MEPISKLGPKWGYILILGGMLSSVACSGKVADLGSGSTADRNAPTYATNAPPNEILGNVDAPPFAMVAEPANITSFGINGDQLYWVSEREGNGYEWVLNRCSVASCAGTRAALAQGTANGTFPGSWAAPIQFDDSSAYFATNSLPNGLFRCVKDGCPQPNLLDLSVTNTSSPVLSGRELYWQSAAATVGHCQAFDCASSIVESEVSTPGGEIALGQLNPLSALTTDGEYLYLSSDSRIWRVKMDFTQPVEVIARDAPFVGGIAVDGDSMYWTESVTLGTVKTCPKVGCVDVPRIIADRLASPTHLAADQGHVYVTEPLRSVAINDGSGTYRPISGTGRLARYSAGDGQATLVLAEAKVGLGLMQFAGNFAYFLACDADLPLPLPTEQWSHHCSISVVSR